MVSEDGITSHSDIILIWNHPGSPSWVFIGCALFVLCGCVDVMVNGVYLRVAWLYALECVVKNQLFTVLLFLFFFLSFTYNLTFLEEVIIADSTSMRE